MNSLASFAVRKALHRGIAQKVRPLTSGVDLDHYSSGWNIADIGEFTKPGKYQIQTFNKISAKVRQYQFGCVIEWQVTRKEMQKEGLLDNISEKFQVTYSKLRNNLYFSRSCCVDDYACLYSCGLIISVINKHASQLNYDRYTISHPICIHCLN